MLGQNRRLLCSVAICVLSLIALAGFGACIAPSLTLSAIVNPQGSGSVSLSPSGGRYANGTDVTITAVPSAGHLFSHWSADISGTNPSVTVTMDSSKMITANFIRSYRLDLTVDPDDCGSVSLEPAAGTYSPGTKVTLRVIPSPDCRFNHWSGDTSGIDSTVAVTMDSDKNLTAHFDIMRTHTLRVVADPSGKGSIILSPAGGAYITGTEVTLTAIPMPGYQFSRWSGDTSSTNPSVSVTMDSNKVIVASFVQSYTLTLTIYPSGDGIVDLDPPGGGYANGTKVTLAAVPTPGYLFSHWSGNITGLGPTITVTIDSDKVITANFVEGMTLNLTIDPGGGGSVNLNPAGGIYTRNTRVTLTATPSPGYGFSHWSGDISSVNPSVTVAMNEDKNVTANFVEGNPLTIFINPEGSGTVNLDPEGGKYITNTQVTLTAAASSGYRFSHWSGDISGTDSTATITMDPSRSVTANFVRVHSLNVIKKPGGAGNVSLSPTGGYYVRGTKVTLTAAPFSGYQFSYWSGDVSGTSQTVTVTMDSDMTITANFVRIYTLSVTADPDNGGSVILSPGGDSYISGTEVTLTAVSSSGYQFSHWSGDISSTSSTTTVIMDGDKSVTANFIRP